MCATISRGPDLEGLFLLFTHGDWKGVLGILFQGLGRSYMNSGGMELEKSGKKSQGRLIVRSVQWIIRKS